MNPLGCVACDRPLGIVKPHTTNYEGGKCAVLCESCWRAHHTPRARLRSYRKQWLTRYGTTLHREWWAIRRAVLAGD